MPADRYQPLLQLVHNRAGDSFRGAVRYDADDWSVLYIRDELATDQLQDAMATIIDRARVADPLVPEDQYQQMGVTQAVVELHDRAVLLHFREGPSRGLIISMDRDVAQGLGQFVNSCNSVLEERRDSDRSGT